MRAVLVLALLAGCTEAPSTRCPSPLHTGAATSTVTIGDDAAAWTDGADVPLILGPQGGYMVTPRLAIDGALAAGETVDLVVTLENREPSGASVFEGFETHETCLRFRRTASGDLATEPIFDQLRWAPAPAGTRLELTATVRSGAFTARSVVTVMLVPES